MLDKNSKDFSLFTDGGTTNGIEGDTPVTPTTTETANQDATAAAQAAAGGESTIVEATPSAEAGAGGETPASPDGTTPTTDGTTPEGGAGDDAGTGGEGAGAEKGDDEFMSMLSALDESNTQGTQKVEDANTTIQEIKDLELPQVAKDKITELETKLTELGLNLSRSNTGNDILKREYQKVVDQLAEYEFGQGSQSKVMSVVDKNPLVKSFLAAQVRFDADGSDANKQQLIQSAKSLYEELTGLTLDDKETDLTGAFGATNDSSISTESSGNDGEDLFA